MATLNRVSALLDAICDSAISVAEVVPEATQGAVSISRKAVRKTTSIMGSATSLLDTYLDKAVKSQKANYDLSLKARITEDRDTIIINFLNIGKNRIKHGAKPEWVAEDLNKSIGEQVFTVDKDNNLILACGEPVSTVDKKIIILP